MQGAGRLRDHRRIVVGLPLEHLGQAMEGEVAEIVGYRFSLLVRREEFFIVGRAIDGVSAG